MGAVPTWASRVRARRQQPKLGKGRAARVALGLCVLGFGYLTGCKEDKPYTPFQVASTLPSAPAIPSLPVAQESAKPSKAFTAAPVIKQARASVWQLPGRTLEAAKDYEIERALVADFNADGRAEAVAWVVPKADVDPLLRPELWLYPNQGESRRLWSLPGFVPTGPNCGFSTNLKHTGPSSITLDVTGNCEARLIARAAVRSIAVITPLNETPVVLALRAATGGPQEQLNFVVTSLDQDDDGRDDVTLTVTVQGSDASARAASAKLLWYDRPSGAARDDSEPGVSLARLASTELVRAKGKGTSPAVPGAVGSLKRLFGALCAEAGTPRLFDAEGDGLACGRLSTTFARMAEAEISAHLKNNQLVEAFGVLVRDAWFAYPATEKEQTARLALFGNRLVQRSAEVKAWLNVELPARGSEPRYSPLDFRGDGSLLVQTTHGVRVASADGSLLEPEAEAKPESEGVSPWPLQVASASGRRWTGVVYSCDRAEVTLSFTAPNGTPLANETTQILAPRPGSCAGGKDVLHPAPAPLGFVGERLLAWVGGSLVGPNKPDTRASGSALSPDARWRIFPTSLGLLLASEERVELWRLPEALSPAGALTDCTVDNAAARVACVRSGRAALIEPTR